MIQHNHIFQSITPNSGNPDCSACRQINPEHMTQHYAYEEEQKRKRGEGGWLW